MPVRWRTERAIRDSRGDHELVPGPEVIEAVVPLGSPGELAGGGVGPDALAAAGAQRVELGVVPL